MNGLRLAHTGTVPTQTACCRCGRSGERWDRIAGRSFCPQCQEALALGESEPLRERTVPNACTICDHVGTVCFHTFPLHKDVPVEMDLCPEHLRCLIGRRLSPFAFHQLRRQLNFMGVCSAAVFLLHDAFYDSQGRALQPIYEQF